MESNRKVAELRAAANSYQWEDMLKLYCQTSAIEYIRLAREINAVCMKVNDKNRERSILIEELETCVGKRLPQKPAQFLRELQNKYDRKVLELHILATKMELGNKEIDVLIQRLICMFPL